MGLKPKKDAAALILAPYLYLGPRTSTTSAFLKSKQITHVLSIGASPISNDPDIVYNRLTLLDNISSSIDEVCNNAAVIIKAAAKKGKILVHCSAAVSRSPTIIAAYLMKHCGMTLRDALGLIIRARAPVCPNPGFIQQLQALDVQLYGSLSLEVESLPNKKEDRLALFAHVGSPARCRCIYADFLVASLKNKR